MNTKLARAWVPAVRITLVDSKGCEWLGELDTLVEAVEDVHLHWMEEPEGPQAFVLQAEDGFVLAMMMRAHDDPEVCFTTYSDGRVEAHRCRYVLDDEGRYVPTEVVLSDPTGVRRDGRMSREG
jgi:hypothetical protein